MESKPTKLLRCKFASQFWNSVQSAKKRMNWMRRRHSTPKVRMVLILNISLRRTTGNRHSVVSTVRTSSTGKNTTELRNSKIIQIDSLVRIQRRLLPRGNTLCAKPATWVPIYATRLSPRLQSTTWSIDSRWVWLKKMHLKPKMLSWLKSRIEKEPKTAFESLEKRLKLPSSIQVLSLRLLSPP